MTDKFYCQKLALCSRLANASSMTMFLGSFGCEMTEQCVLLVVMSIPSLLPVIAFHDLSFHAISFILNL